MSSDWQPPRTPLFGIALIPPTASAGTTADKNPASPASGPSEAAVKVSASAPLPPHESRAESAGWTAVAASAAVPVVIAAAAEAAADLWPEKWLHPAERRALARWPPSARRRALALLTAARRALVEALALPEPAAASVDLSPLLDGVQSLRTGGWTLQRVPSPAGVHVVAAAPGSGWTYSLLPPPSGAALGRG